MNPEQFLETLWQERATAILRTDDQDAAYKAMDAAVRGGFKVIEFTLSVPGVFELISEFAQREELVVGAGTVVRPEDARRAVDAGARFIVSPVIDEAVISEAVSMGVAAMPGTHTATEMLRAHRAGAQLQKLFPAPGTGPDYVRSLLGPLPYLRIVPTNGVDEGNVPDWLAAGCFAVGFVATLFIPDEIKRGNFDRIEEMARISLQATRDAPRPERGNPYDPFA
jgi:Entner-Doudoroff aldolase